MIPKIYPITCNTNNIGPGSTFVAIKGYKKNGNKYIKKAIQLGATKIISEERIKNKIKKIEYIKVKNSRKALAIYCSKTLSNPSSKLKIIGITGTKGKTTTVHLIEHILKKSGYKTALLGTIKNKILNNQITSQNTTPQSDYLHMFFDVCVKSGVEYVVMEVSSHALSLYRTYGIKFDSVGFTNLDSEHLDFYKNMQNYFMAKYKIFEQVKSNSQIILNANSKWGKKLYEKLKKYKKYAKTKIIKFDQNDLIKIDNKKMFGQHNLYNITMAFLICKNLGIKEKTIKKSIENFEGVEGRLQMHILKKGAKAFVDFAHNPSSMEAVLKTLRTKTQYLIVVFGCGGNKDKIKRPIMGKIASEYADKIIITNDNPRFENPKQIAKEIINGISNKNIKKCLIQLNRKKAIEKAVQISKKQSVIAILGKGHENHYIIKNKQFYLNDFEQIRKY